MFCFCLGYSYGCAGSRRISWSWACEIHRPHSLGSGPLTVECRVPSLWSTRSCQLVVVVWLVQDRFSAENGYLEIKHFSWPHFNWYYTICQILFVFFNFINLRTFSTVQFKSQTFPLGLIGMISSPFIPSSNPPIAK